VAQDDNIGPNHAALMDASNARFDKVENQLWWARATVVGIATIGAFALLGLAGMGTWGFSVATQQLAGVSDRIGRFERQVEKSLDRLSDTLTETNRVLGVVGGRMERLDASVAVVDDRGTRALSEHKGRPYSEAHPMQSNGRP